MNHIGHNMILCRITLHWIFGSMIVIKTYIQIMYLKNRILYYFLDPVSFSFRRKNSCCERHLLLLKNMINESGWVFKIQSQLRWNLSDNTNYCPILYFMSGFRVTLWFFLQAQNTRASISGTRIVWEIIEDLCEIWTIYKVTSKEKWNVPRI